MFLTTGSFHLLHLMFDDYVLYLVENLYNQERSRDFLRRIKGEITGLIHYCISVLSIINQFFESLYELGYSTNIRVFLLQDTMINFRC